MFECTPTLRDAAAVPRRGDRRVMGQIYWVSPDIDRWRVQREGAHRAERIFSDREDAIDWTCRMAAGLRPCRVKIQDNGGRVVEQLDFDAVAAAA